MAIVSRRVAGAQAVQFHPSSQPLRRVARWARRNAQLVLGAVLLGGIFLSAAFAPLLTPHDPISQDLVNRLKPPVWEARGTWLHPLGTDEFGRDVLSRLLYGARYSGSIVAATILVSGVFGVLLGTMAGYFGGWTEMLIMRASDTQQALPTVLIALMVVAVFGGGIVNLTIVLALTGWVQYSRILFSAVRGLRSQDFVTAAICLGSLPSRILLRHILPNVASPIIVISTLLLGRMLLLEAGLSFLGLGVPQPLPDWGTMLADGQRAIFTTPWLATLPGLAITFTVWSANLLGEGLRRYLDPHSRQEL